jgi:MoaA/NifB/PqqE/SkfB family radical SAM enzyme
MYTFLEKIKIGATKIARIPPHQFLQRLYLGVKKHFLNYPTYIVYQTVSACNLQCKHCFINNYGNEIADGVTKIVLFDEFTKIADRITPLIKNCNFFVFSTFEALLNKDLFRMMDYLLAINPKLQFPFLSNTMQLTEEKINLLEKYPISEINISLDGTTKEVVENFKTGVVYEKIIAALEKLSKSTLKDKVAITFVAHKNNIHQLPDHLNLIHQFGVKTIYVSNLLSFTKENQDMVLYSKEGNSYADKIFEESIQVAKRNKQIIQLPLTKPKLKGCQACEAFFINHNGNVSPCDFLAVTTPFTLFGTTTQSAPVVFGNVLYDDPLAIYRSEAFVQFRHQHRVAKKLPPACESCIDAYGLMCSNRTIHASYL